MKISKKDLIMLDNLINDKLKSLRFGVLELESYCAYVSSYDYLEEKYKLEKQIDLFTKLRSKILKLMEE